MTTEELVAHLINRLGLTGALVYDGHVPDQIPTFPGTAIVRPYLVIWAMPTREGEEQDLAYSHQNSRSDLTITVAAGSVETVRHHSQQAIGLLHRQTLPGGGELRHTDPHVAVQWDETVTPGRFYQPLVFMLLQP